MAGILITKWLSFKFRLDKIKCCIFRSRCSAKLSHGSRCLMENWGFSYIAILGPPSKLNQIQYLLTGAKFEFAVKAKKFLISV